MSTLYDKYSELRSRTLGRFLGMCVVIKTHRDINKPMRQERVDSILDQIVEVGSDYEAASAILDQEITENRIAEEQELKDAEETTQPD